MGQGTLELMLMACGEYDSKAHIGTLNAPSNVLWSPPSNGVIKINTNGGISSRNGVAGIGFVMRGHNGSAVVTENRRIAYAKPKRTPFCGLSRWLYQKTSEMLSWRRIQVFLPTLFCTTRS
nr:reverse transcriptase [Tanacetum cinerariifolium]GFB78286.1 reverse transcriptase [Tanacetum cinerariifolium]